MGSRDDSALDDTVAPPISGDDATIAPTSGDDATVAPSGVDTVKEPRVVVREGKRADYEQLVEVDPSHYQRGEEIAKGGMGRIFAGRDLRLGRPVAIKELLVTSGELRARFEREARITARLQHPSIVNVLEAGTWPGGEPFYAMKLVTGESLDKVIAKTTTLAERLALLPNAIAVCDALAYAHAGRVIHRDLKPANVIVGEFGETVVIDWGLAKDLSSEATDDALPQRPSAEGETVMGSILGTPAYMPPEQARGDAVDERADVYALGALLYHTFGGEPPYRAKNTAAVVQLVLDKPPRSIRDAAPGIPPDLAAVVEKAMARAPADRYPTANGLAEELKRFQTGQLVGAHRYSAWALVRWIRRHRAAVTIAALSAIALAVLSYVGVKQIVHERNTAQARARDASAARDEVRVRLSRLYEEQGRQLFLDGQVGPSLVYLSEAYKLADRPSLRFLLARALPALDARTLRTIAARGAVRRFALSPDASKLVTVANEGVQLWDLATGSTIAIDASEVREIAWATDGRFALASPVDVAVFDARGQRTLAIPAVGHALAFIHGGRSLAIAGGGIRIFDVASGKLVREIKSERSALHGELAMAHTGNVTKIVQLADPPPQKSSWENEQFAPGFDYVESPVWSPDGKRVLLDDTVYYTTSVGLMAKVSPVVEDGTRLAAFSPAATSEVPASDVLATTDRGHTITLWNMAYGKSVMSLAGHTGPIVDLAYDAGGARIATASEDGTARIWDAESGKLLALLPIGPGARAARFIGDRVLTIAGGELRVWHVPQRAGSLTVGFANAQIVGYAFSPAGTLLAIAGREQAHAGQHGVALWNAQTGKLHAMLATERPVTAFAWNPDPRNEQLLIATEDGMRFWSTNGRSSAVDGVTGRVTRIEWGTHARAVVEDGGRIAISELSIPRSIVPLSRAPLALAPNGELALVCDKVCELVGANRKTPIALAAKHAAFSADGKRVGIATATHLHVLDIDGAERAKLPGAFGRPTFSLDGAQIAAPDTNGGGRIWDAATGALRATFAGPKTTITSLQLTPDRSRLVTTAYDRTARIWDAANGSLLDVLQNHENTIESAALSRDGKRLATQVLGQSRLRIWELADEQRTSAEVSAIVRCHVALALVEGRALPTAPAPVDCAQ